MPRGRPDFQLGVGLEANYVDKIPIDIVAQTISNLKTDIVAQTVEKLKVDIVSQTLAELAVNVTRGTISVGAGVIVNRPDVPEGWIGVTYYSHALQNANVLLSAVFSKLVDKTCLEQMNEDVPPYPELTVRFELPITSKTYSGNFVLMYQKVEWGWDSDYTAKWTFTSYVKLIYVAPDGTEREIASESVTKSSDGSVTGPVNYSYEFKTKKDISLDTVLDEDSKLIYEIYAKMETDSYVANGYVRIRCDPTVPDSFIVMTYDLKPFE